MNTEVNIHNKFEFELIDSKSGESKAKATAYNTVLDNYFLMMLGYSYPGGSNAVDRVIKYLLLGTGDLTGIDVTDTTRVNLVSGLAAKGVTLQSIDLEDDGINVAQYTATFTETEANATITEVALSVGNSFNSSAHSCVTWAPITDSEGHPTSITKTNSDILHVTATIYSRLRLDASSPVHAARKVFPYYYTASTDHPAWIGPLNYEDTAGQSENDPPRVASALIRTTLGASNLAIPSSSGSNTAVQLNYTTVPLLWNVSPGWETDSDRLYHISGSNSWNSQEGQDGSIRVSTAQVLSSAANSPGNPLIKAITLEAGFWISFPNHTVYPPVELTLEAAGDGSTTDFNLGVPELMANGVQVTIDGTTIPASGYTWYGRDYNYGQAFKSYDTKYLSRLPKGATYGSHSSSYAVPFAPGYLNSVGGGFLADGSDESYYYWDFGEAYTVSTLTRLGKETNSSHDIHVSLEYSNDNQNWTPLIATTYSSTTNPMILTADTPVSARYWRLWAYDYNYHHVDTIKYTDGFWLAFGDPKPTIRFNTPPAAGSKIIVKAKCEYPIKNTNWSIDASTFDMNIVRGS